MDDANGDNDTEVVNGVALATVGEALGSNYSPTSDLMELSAKWGVNAQTFDSDAIGPVDVDTASLLESSKSTAIPSLVSGTSAGLPPDEGESAGFAVAGKAVTSLQKVVSSGGAFRNTATGKVIGAISDVATPIAGAINPIAGLAVGGALTVIGAIGDIVTDAEQQKNRPILKTREWGSDIGLIPPISAVAVAAPEPVRYGEDKPDFQQAYRAYGFNIPGL